MDNDTAERIFDASLAIDNIIHLSAQLACDEKPPEAITNLLEGLSGCTGKGREGLPKVLTAWLEFVDKHGDPDEDDDEILLEHFRDWARHNEFTGFLLEVSAPYYKAGQQSYSPGIRNRNWFYGPGWDEALEAAIAWAEARQEAWALTWPEAAPVAAKQPPVSK